MCDELITCCDDMKSNILQTHIVHYNVIFNEYGLNALEDGVSCILLNYCPWCGKKLPFSSRLEWFDELEKMGYDAPLLRDDIPLEYKSARWRMKGRYE